MKNQILIKDFNLFIEVIKSAQKIVNSAKIILNENGLQIYGVHNKVARCELTTNSVYSNQNIDFCILDMSIFAKVLATIKDIHNNDYEDFKFFLEKPFIKFESKKFKTKLITCNYDVISSVVSEKVKTQLTSILDFTTNSNYIKQICNHTFIFNDPQALRIYIGIKEDMEKNVIYATLGNNDTNLNNEITLKLGLITFGKCEKDRKIIIDLDRLNLFNVYQTDKLNISLMDKNVLVSDLTITGKNDSYFNLKIYNSMLKD